MAGTYRSGNGASRHPESSCLGHHTNEPLGTLDSNHISDNSDLDSVESDPAELDISNKTRQKPQMVSQPTQQPTNKLVTTFK